MGLDITAYSGLKQDDGGEVSFCQMDCFAGREEGIQLGRRYQPEDEFCFRAGSYSGYNAWREQLAKLAGYPAVEHDAYGKKEQSHAAGCWVSDFGPFYELINFADNEGTIGPVVAKKLLADFEQFEEKAREHQDDGWFYECYTNWKRAFKMASENGAVAFH